jgi:hypothetical protein
MHRRGDNQRTSNGKKAVLVKDPLAATLSAGQKYSQLLRELTKVVYSSQKQSQKAYLFDAHSILRDINKCLQNELNVYRKYSTD